MGIKVMRVESVTFLCLQISQKANEIFSRISALASKKMLNKKNKDTLLH